MSFTHVFAGKEITSSYPFDWQRQNIMNKLTTIGKVTIKRTQVQQCTGWNVCPSHLAETFAKLRLE